MSHTRRPQPRGGKFFFAFGVLLFAFVALASLPGFAQGNGRITGVVADPSGAAIPGAKVNATQSSTGLTISTTTAGDGTYVFPSVRPALYDLTVSGPGFGTYEQKGIVVEADAAVTVNVVLKVGQQSETVTVNADASQVNTTTATLSEVVPQHLINDLPLNGRNAASLTTLVAGVVVAPNAQADQGSTKTFPEVVAVTANGSRVGQTDYLLDGGNNVDEYTNVNAPFPFPDALQEFSVQTNNYNAEYGQNAGGVVNIITQSGTNTLHGDLFEYLRNAYFNAPPWFSAKKQVDPLKRNQFGGTIGGPFKLPGVSTPHSYFFAGYQRTVIRNNPLSSTAAFVPTTSEIAGTFNVTNSAGCLKNPFTGAPYPCTAIGGNPGVSTIDPTTYDPASVALLKYLPQGDPNSGAFFFQKPTRTNLDEFVGRFDHEIGNNDRLTARYFYDRYHNAGVLDLSDLLTYSDQATINYQNFLISESHSFSNRLLNNFIVSYQRDRSSRGPLAGGISVADLGVNMWQPAFKQINQIQTTGFFTIGDNPAATFNRYNYTLTDDLNWVRGPHNLAFGFHTELSYVSIHNDFRQPGAFTFDATNSGNAIANFLLGYLSNFQQASGQFFDNRGKFFGVYGQDSWKVTRRLTLNYGLRWEPFIPWNEVDNRMGEFSPSAFAAGTHSAVYPNAPTGLLFVGDSGVDRYGIRHVYHDFMPRIGFAWDIFGNGKTSLRGGAGSFYDTRLSSVFNNIFSNGSPFVTTVNISPPQTPGSMATFSNPYAGIVNPFPAPQPAPKTTLFPTQSYLTFDPYHQFSVPQFFSWNLALERQLTGSALVRLAYVGSNGEHLWAPVELNPSSFNPNLPKSNPTFENPRAYAPTYTQPITEANYGANSNYHSLQASLEQRLRRGLSVMANYTWSKALDDLPWNAAVTAIGSNNSYVYPIYVPNFRSLDYGPSDFDHRNVFSLSYVWEFPKISSGGPLRYVVNGWQTNGIFQFRSGDPLTVFSNQNNNSRSSQSRDRALVVSGVDPYSSSTCATSATPCKSYLNKSAFQSLPTTPDGTYGDAKKGSLTGPQYADWDVSMMRHFNFTERWELEFRCEYFNALNHPNFGDPSTTAGASTFGRITSTSTSNGSTTTYDPRIGQLSLKLFF